MAKAQQDASSPAYAVPATETSLLDQIAKAGRLPRDAAARRDLRDVMKALVEEIEARPPAVSRDTEAMINARIDEIDKAISKQLTQILHHPEFQRLESTWRGLKYLLSQSETGTQLKIKVLNVAKPELLRDLQRAPEFDQSALFKKVYEQGYGTFGGQPFSCLLGDYAFDHTSPDVEMLEKVSNVAAAAHAPFIASASADMFNLDAFTQLDQPRDLAKVLDTVEYAEWKAFRETEDARYVALTLPRFLLRRPYGATNPAQRFDYDEEVDGRSHDAYLWGNAAWAFGARLTASFAQYGWCARIRGVESGGLVQGLPVHTFTTDGGDVVMKSPTETSITDRREKELADLGFVPLVHQADTPNAAFFSAQSAQKPKMFNKPEANANARLSAQMPYIFAVSRFAHYLKVIMRDKIGEYMSASEATTYLNTWIQQYIVPNDDAPAESKARKPLKEARVDVVEVPGKPGALRAVAFLRPHFQLDELTISMRLVADLPAPKKG